MERPDRYFIPANLNDGRALFHIPNRNVIDTAAMELVTFLIVRALPLGSVAMVVVGALAMIGVGIVGIVGIKNESVSEFLVAYLKHRRVRKKLHFRRPDQHDEIVKKPAE